MKKEELNKESKMFAYQLYTMLVYVLKVFHFYLFISHFRFYPRLFGIVNSV